MTLPKILFGVLIGISASSYHHQKQITKERKTFIECQEAWEKYYQLDQPTQKQYSEAISKKLNTWGLKITPGLITAGWHLAQQQWPLWFHWLSYSNKKEQSGFTLEQQKYLVYHHEVLPKCQKVQEWTKQMKYLSAHSKS